MNPISRDHRFQGAFLGIVLAYRLGQWKRVSGSLSPRSSPQGGEWIPRLTQSLIQHQGFNPTEAWAMVAPQGLTSGSEVAVTGFPLALFFHDNFNALQQLRTHCPEPVAGVWDGVIAMATAVAVLLSRNPELDQLIPHLLTALPPETVLTAQLEKVQTLLQQKASLETAVRQLTPTLKPSLPQSTFSAAEGIPQDWTALALGFYCFLSTPEDYSLTVLRSLQTPYHPEITAAISGALSGAHQGCIAIPVKWRLELQDPSLWHSTHPEIESNPIKPNNNSSELLQLARNLFDFWSGVWQLG